MRITVREVGVEDSKEVTPVAWPSVRHGDVEFTDAMEHLRGKKPEGREEQRKEKGDKRL